MMQSPVTNCQPHTNKGTIIDSTHEGEKPRGYNLTRRTPEVQKDEWMRECVRERESEREREREYIFVI